MKKEGRHLSVRIGQDEAYRCTQKPDGKWLWCDNFGNSGGDNIDLVMELEPGTGFTDAVFKLAGEPALQARSAPMRVRVAQARPTLPPLADAAEGRSYLRGRGITPESIEQAERSGMLTYVGGGVVFVGRDSDGNVRNATKRATDPSAEIPKRDFKGSDKSFPPVIPGNPESIWIVEGGTDALATLDMAKRQGKPAPTIIVSGGANVRGWLDNPEVQQIISKAQRIAVIGEREKDAETQLKTDAAHGKQVDAIKLLSPNAEVKLWTPPAKDLAAYNELQAAELAEAAKPKTQLSEGAQRAVDVANKTLASLERLRSQEKQASKDESHGLGL